LAYGPEAFCSKYVSIGAKSYALEIKTPNEPPIEMRKLKGITLKHNNKHLTDFNTMKRLVDGDLDAVTIKLVNKIERSKDFRIFTKQESNKKIQLVYNKRARLSDSSYQTKPWGMRQNAPEVVPDPNIFIEDWSFRSYLYSE